MHSPYNPSDWARLIPNIQDIVRQMELTPILSVGITPYTRIIPAFFLKNYSIYTVKRSSDVADMEKVLRMYVLEDKFPDIATRVHGTGYLIGNHTFQAFVKSRRPAAKLMFYTMTDKIVNDLDRLKISWIGNHPSMFEDVMLKGSFRALVKDLGLPTLPSVEYTRDELFASTYADVSRVLGGSFVVQRADKEVGGNEGTFFIHTDADFDHCLAALTPDTSFTRVVVTRFIKGWSTSMLGCVMQDGVLSGPLQLQLIDVPQSLHGVAPNGIFFGNDLGFNEWSEETESVAQTIVERIGEHLRASGYRGIFGIDMLYDTETGEIFPNECNPRFTGSLVLHSLMMLEQKTPPLEFFHLMAHLGISTAGLDYAKINEALKTRTPCAHIAFSPKGITSMQLPLPAGVYNFNPTSNEPLTYKGPGVSLADLRDEGDFMLIDTVPSLGASIEQQVPRLFKFIFPRSIAKSSYEIDDTAGYLVERFAAELLTAAQNKTPKS
ncbi:MAG TPA: hypothetical protein VIY48_02115 [Candidatus Paceibacterota bacterium]